MKRISHYCRFFLALVKFLPSLLIYFFRPEHKTLEHILSNDLISKWIKGLLMYGYSMPYSSITDFPKTIAEALLKNVLFDRRWKRIPGGVYSYMKKITEAELFDVYTDCGLLQIKRSSEDVEVVSNDTSHYFDCIVFAVPPSEILPILSDPSEKEIHHLELWKINIAETIIHTDETIYHGKGTAEFTEFDIFEIDGNDAGYNAYLNRLLGLKKNHETNYFLGFNMDTCVKPDKILHRYIHETTLFNGLTDNRAKIRNMNGHNRTYFAGAYLYDALHEGAIQSALAVFDLIEQN